MSSIGPLWLGPSLVVAAAELTLYSARLPQSGLRAAADANPPAGKTTTHKIGGQECVA